MPPWSRAGRSASTSPQLRFLNSSGINTISRFVITARKEDRAHLRIVGSQEVYWQQKSLSNLQKLWPDVQIEIQ